MGVAVKEPVVEDLLHVRLEADLGHLAARHAESPDRVPVVRADAVDPLHHEQVRPREVPVDARDADAFDAPHVLAQPVRVLPVADEVELAPYVLLELRDHPRGVVHGQIGEPLFDLYGDHLQDRDVLIDRRRDPRALYLQHDARAVGEDSGVNLCEGGRGQRLRIDRTQAGLQLGALCADVRLHLCERDRGHVVLEVLELLDQSRWKKVAADAHHLPELDVRGPELLEGETDPRIDRTVHLRPSPHAEPDLHRRQLVDQDAEAVPDHDVGDSAPSAETERHHPFSFPANI